VLNNGVNNKPLDKIMKGTTTVGIVCKDGVIFATDTRVTAGYYVAHKRGKKVFPIDKHIAMTIAGAVADAQSVLETLKANVHLFRLTNGRPMSVSAAARLTANILFQSRMAPLLMEAIIGGIDDTGAHIYAIDPFGSLIEEKCVSTGSGSPIAYGILEDKYREDLTVKEGIPLVVSSVYSAMKRDIGSGDSFDVAIITKDGYRELGEEDKKKLLNGIEEIFR